MSKTATKNKITVYDVVTSKIIELIESNQTLPWQRSWSTNFQTPMNYFSKYKYNGINRFLCSALFSDPYFLTFKQIAKMGGKVKKGEKALPIIYWSFLLLDKDGKTTKDPDKVEKRQGFLRYTSAFNASQIEGIDFEYPEVKEYDDNQKIELCENIISSHKDLKLQFKDENRAYYAPGLDVINMPPLKRFNSSEEYYSTLFHETAHWTGHSSRLQRLKDDHIVPSFGSTDYSKEELVAEMTASFLCEYTQIANTQTLNNSAAYLKGWLSKLKSDTKMLVSAGAKAHKAFEFIISKEAAE